MTTEKMAISVEEMGAMLGISRSVAYKLSREKGFPAVRVSANRVIIPVKPLEKWLEERTQG